MTPTLSAHSIRSALARLDKAASLAESAPPEPGHRRPVHVVYGGAHLFRFDTAPRLGRTALSMIEEYAPSAESFAAVVGLAPELAGTVYERVVRKLSREPVEDFRIDFEDGYGHRRDDEEDDHAVAAAGELARGLAEGTLPPFTGVRIKPLTRELGDRSLRTLDLFVTTLVRRAGRTPGSFVVTLPKVTHPGEASVLAGLLAELEAGLGLDQGAIGLELMVETPQAVIDGEGRLAARRFVEAAADRLRGFHFGPYDYTASLGITAGGQGLAHPACDLARELTRAALAGTGLPLADGPVTFLPVPPHRAPAGTTLPDDARRENRCVVHEAWRLHTAAVRRSLEHGFYQGWDLHPGQLPTRFAAVYAFFLAELPRAGERLRSFVEQATRATLDRGVFDDAATGQGLLNSFLGAVGCGAITEEEAAGQTGLSIDDLRTRSFHQIVQGRHSHSVRPAR